MSCTGKRRTPPNIEVWRQASTYHEAPLPVQSSLSLLLARRDRAVRLTRSSLFLHRNRIAQLLHKTVYIPQHPSLDNPALDDAENRHPRVVHLPARRTDAE